MHDIDDEPIDTVPLGTARHEPNLEEGFGAEDLQSVAALAHAAEEAIPLEERVRTVVATMSKTTVDQLQEDADGDIGIRAGSAMVFVRVRDNPPLVDVFSPILTEIEPTEKLYVKLSELTNRMPIGRLYIAQDTVWASIPVFGSRAGRAGRTRPRSARRTRGAAPAAPATSGPTRRTARSGCPGSGRRCPPPGRRRSGGRRPRAAGAPSNR